MAKGKCRAMLGHDLKLMGKKYGTLNFSSFGDEPALPGLSKGNSVQLKSSLKAKELILLLPGNLWQGLANIF